MERDRLVSDFGFLVVLGFDDESKVATAHSLLSKTASVMGVPGQILGEGRMLSLGDFDTVVEAGEVVPGKSVINIQITKDTTVERMIMLFGIAMSHEQVMGGGDATLKHFLCRRASVDEMTDILKSRWRTSEVSIQSTLQALAHECEAPDLVPDLLRIVSGEESGLVPSSENEVDSALQNAVLLLAEKTGITPNEQTCKVLHDLMMVRSEAIDMLSNLRDMDASGQDTLVMTRYFGRLLELARMRNEPAIMMVGTGVALAAVLSEQKPLNLGIKDTEIVPTTEEMDELRLCAKEFLEILSKKPVVAAIRSPLPRSL